MPLVTFCDASHLPYTDPSHDRLLLAGFINAILRFVTQLTDNPQQRSTLMDEEIGRRELDWGAEEAANGIVASSRFP